MAAAPLFRRVALIGLGLIGSPPPPPPRPRGPPRPPPPPRTPPPATAAAAVERVAELWRRCGSQVEVMDPRHHDAVLAITSHLPHLIAYTIVGTATDLEARPRRGGVK